MNIENNVPVKRYLGLFLGGYLLTYVAIIAIVLLLNIEKLSASTIIAMFAGATWASSSFVKREARPPSSAEKSKLVWGSLIIMVIVELIIAAITIGSGVFGEEMETLTGAGGISVLIGIMVVVFGIMLLIAFFLLRWIYGSQAEKMSEKYEEKRVGKTFD